MKQHLFGFFYAVTVIFFIFSVFACAGGPETVSGEIPGMVNNEGLAVITGSDGEADSGDTDRPLFQDSLPPLPEAGLDHATGVTGSGTASSESDESPFPAFYPEPDALIILPRDPQPAEPVPEGGASAGQTSGTPDRPSAPAARAAPAAPAARAAPAAPAAPAPGVPSTPAQPPQSEQEPAGSLSEPVPPVSGGVWESEPVVPGPFVHSLISEPRPDRRVQLEVTQVLEVPYPGSGWVFLGDSTSQNGIRYESRKLEGRDTLFSFRPLKEGVYLLTFSRFDVLKDDFISDVLQVTVTASTGRQISRVRSAMFTLAAPGPSSSISSASSAASPLSVSPAPESLSRSSSAEPQTTGRIPSASSANEPSLVAAPVLQGPAVITESDPVILLGEIRTALGEGQSDTALDLLSRFFAVSVSQLDEGLFLQGQALESSGPRRDIRKALESYQKLVSAYPDSRFWNDADARIRFIRQFYFSIR